jgi:predicted alpha/beta-fold hydrolase
MQLIRTTLRLPFELKKAAERIASDSDTSLQDVFHRALTHYIKTLAKEKARRIIFKTHDLGTPLDKLNRADYYAKF